MQFALNGHTVTNANEARTALPLARQGADAISQAEAVLSKYEAEYREAKA